MRLFRRTPEPAPVDSVEEEPLVIPEGFVILTRQVDGVWYAKIDTSQPNFDTGGYEYSGAEQGPHDTEREAVNEVIEYPIYFVLEERTKRDTPWREYTP